MSPATSKSYHFATSETAVGGTVVEISIPKPPTGKPGLTLESIIIRNDHATQFIDIASKGEGDPTSGGGFTIEGTVPAADKVGPSQIEIPYSDDQIRVIASGAGTPVQILAIWRS